jgi:hypothetical protein
MLLEGETRFIYRRISKLYMHTLHPQFYMFKDSIWYPDTPIKFVIVAAVVAMVVLHHTSFTPIYSSTYLVFGWIPVQIAYDIALLLVSMIVLFGMYKASPDTPPKFETSDEPDPEVTKTSKDSEVKTQW